MWTRGDSSSWCSEQPRRTALAALLQPLGSPSLPSWSPGPRGPRGNGKLGTWFLSCLCLSRLRPAWPGLAAVGTAVSAARLRVAVSSSCTPPPGVAAAAAHAVPTSWGLSRLGLTRSLLQMTGGIRESNQVNDCFTTSGERAAISGTSRQGSAQGFMRRGNTVPPPSFHLLTPRLSSPSSDPATINTAWGRVHTYQALCNSQGSGTQIPSPHCSPSDLRKRALCPVTGHRNIVFSGGEEARGWSREWGLLAWPTLLTSTHAQFCLLKNIYVYWNIVDSMLC